MSNETEKARTQLPVELKINGQGVRGRPGQTVLDVVREHNIDDIPSLCHDPKLEPFGSCFVCVVEVKGARGLVPSCTTRIRDGMEVTTRNERIINARKSALELLLSDHYADCLCPGQVACPAGVDVQGYLSLARLGLYDQALSLIKERNPLPVVCGRICVRKCEVNCRRNLVDEPVGINYAKRFIGDHSNHELLKPNVKSPTGKRIAVVGGGPAGLTAAYYLTIEGHSVTIFESMPALGGMLLYGIPEYRLPKAELDKEIGEIISLGVEVKVNKKLGRDFTIDKLKKDEKFDAVFLAMGAPVGSKLGVSGEDAEGIESGLDFLRDTQLKSPRKLHGKVVVVGGGNSAIDAARTAVRCGADEVAILYRRTRAEMPAHHEEVDAAEKEGVRLELLAAPEEVLTDGKRLKALKCIRMELGEPDASGRRRPVPIKGSEFNYHCDFVFAAIGQEIEKDVLANEPENQRPAVSRKGAIKVDETTMATNVPGVFAAGDVVTGPAVVIDAVAQGHRAAEVIHEFLNTGQVKKPSTLFMSKRDLFGKISERLFEDVPKIPRAHLPEREPGERKNDFLEVESGLSPEIIVTETDRCMECGCKAKFECDLRRYCTDYNVDILRLSGTVRKHKVDSSHPLINFDPNKCILCGRCVRMCTEIMGLPILGFVGRGFTTLIKPSLGKPLGESQCIACGACIETCPTGALTAKLPYGKQGPWKTKAQKSVCGFCSVGCDLDLKVVADGLFWATSPNNPHIGDGNLCFKGRFGTTLIQRSERLQKPMVRQNGQLVETDWETAISEAARILGKAMDKWGADSIAALAVPRMTMEECYLVGQLARAALGTDQIASSGIYGAEARHDLDNIIGETTSTCFKEDIDAADLILLVGADPSHTHPVIGMSLRRATRKGAKLAVINSSNIDLVRSSHLWLDPRRGTMGVLLAGVLRQTRGLKTPPIGGEAPQLGPLDESLANFTPSEITQVAGVPSSKVEELASLIAGSQKVVAIYDLDETMERASDDLAILAQILILTGHLSRPESGILLLQADSNSEGARVAGMRRGELVGGHPFSADEFRRKVAAKWNVNLDRINRSGPNLTRKFSSGEIHGALVFFNDLLLAPEAYRSLASMDALVVVDNFMSETAKAAHVVLPGATLAESNGTVVSFDRRVKPVGMVSTPPGGLSTAEVIARLSTALGHKISTSNDADVRREMCEILGIPAEVLEKAREKGDQWPISNRLLKFNHLKELQLSSRPWQGGRASLATLDVYIQKRLSQMGLMIY